VDIVHHCESSVRKFGGEIEDYAAIHAFFDSGKTLEPTWRHRILLHHTLGVKLCELKFGSLFRRHSDNKAISTTLIAEQHVLEDLGALPTPYWYLRELPLDYLEKARLYGYDFQLRLVCSSNARAELAKTYGGQAEDYRLLQQFLQLSELYVPDVRRYALLHTTFGCAIAQDIFGSEYVRPSDGNSVSVPEVIKHLIILELGCLAEPSSVLQALPLRTWLNGMKPSTRSRLSKLVESETGLLDF
jgi:hypothetical protein